MSKNDADDLPFDIVPSDIPNEGILHRQEANGGDAYSGNAVVGKHVPDQPQRLLIQSSISYDGRRVNECQWLIENIGRK